MKQAPKRRSESGISILNTALRGNGSLARRLGEGGMTDPGRRLEHFPEKWIPVFRKEMRQTSNLERFPATVPAISRST
jgi:hypothetical protein